MNSVKDILLNKNFKAVSDSKFERNDREKYVEVEVKEGKMSLFIMNMKNGRIIEKELEVDRCS